jgi:hypothetical protein
LQSARTHGEDRAVAFELFNMASKRKRLARRGGVKLAAVPPIQNDGEASRNGEADAWMILSGPITGLSELRTPQAGQHRA